VHVKSARTIYLTKITQSAPEIAFPEVVDKTFIEASAILKNHSLKIADTSYINDIARDVVLEVKFAGQPVQPGRMVPKGSNITLILGNGRGNTDVDIPNLIGLPLNEAKFALAGLGLAMGSVSFNSMDRDTSGSIIVAQNPDTSSSIISIGSAIHVTLGKPTSVPEDRLQLPYDEHDKTENEEKWFDNCFIADRDDRCDRRVGRLPNVSSSQYCYK